MREQENLLLGRAPCSPLCPAKRSIARLACAPEADAKGPAPRAKQVVLAGEIQLPHAWTAVSDQTGAYFVEVACLALAECRLKGFKQHVQARDRSAAHTSRTKTRPSRCLNGAAAADAQLRQQRSSGSSTRQVQGMPAAPPSCGVPGEDGEPRRTSARAPLWFDAWGGLPGNVASISHGCGGLLRALGHEKLPWRVVL